jgi:hypothetical protein
LAEAATAISNLEAAVIEYQSHEGQPNMPLIETRNEVVRLTAELEAVKKRFAEIEARGSWLDPLSQAAFVSESRVESLLNHYQRVVTDELIHMRYGQRINFASLGSEAKGDLRMHVRITNFRRFRIGRRGDFEQITPEHLFQRAEKAATTLDALRRYIQGDQAEYSKK